MNVLTVLGLTSSLEGLKSQKTSVTLLMYVEIPHRMPRNIEASVDLKISRKEKVTDKLAII